ncbi:TPR repeat protein [[Actinomadura] parvosata subsp. kistnae]|uniref:CHAT domain-containing protein n=1 Tax=[Actinomadura] parvosata subsp. kistnae TaxID=1909395 RepID=A0A1U9ZSD2_9ACTN|nr:CHAT domain-containing protein [Nonomuraea sp. ATCC 55076]AQZ60854.1 hypothetical protein BKM31_04535 [Nonomuraea sp. ATCC 55076]SPL90484.1 TPR repeat protein [Actinomadura parvosata subsp. kistnae]
MIDKYGQRHLVLEASDYRAPGQWRWSLLDETTPVGDHQVNLAPEDACLLHGRRLYHHVRHDTDLDDLLGSEARLVAEVGRCIGDKLLGDLRQELIRHTPALVEVRVPAKARGLHDLPLEIGHVRGEPLITQGVTLVHAPTGAPPLPDKSGVDEPLRALAVFSLPYDEDLLELRAQRKELVELFSGLQAQGRQATLKVLQWRVTEKSLDDAMQQAFGWDVVHFFGHGLVDALVIQQDDGSQARLRYTELRKRLEPTRHRLKLVVLSSCFSAGTPDPGMLPIAEQLAAEFGCAVIGMRYDLGGDFSQRLTRRLYDAMLRLGQPLTRALQWAVKEAAAPPYGSASPPRSVAVPVVYGTRALNLVLAPTVEPPSMRINVPMAYFERQPPSFVGRAREMALADRAITDDASAGVLFYGSPGVGTTACALELAYSHPATFGTLLWHSIDLPGNRIAGALDRLAEHLDGQLEALELRAALREPGKLAARLRLIEAFLRDQVAVLTVIDNVTALLDEPSGQWRDKRWPAIMNALSGGGRSRLLLTGGALPPGLPTGLLPIQIKPMTRREAVLYARGLAPLKPLFHSDPSGLATILTTAAGNPKTIADATLPISGTCDPEYLRIIREFAH